MESRRLIDTFKKIASISASRSIEPSEPRTTMPSMSLAFLRIASAGSTTGDSRAPSARLFLMASRYRGASRFCGDRYRAATIDEAPVAGDLNWLKRVSWMRGTQLHRFVEAFAFGPCFCRHMDRHRHNDGMESQTEVLHFKSLRPVLRHCARCQWVPQSDRSWCNHRSRIVAHHQFDVSQHDIARQARISFPENGFDRVHSFRGLIGAQRRDEP